MGVSDLSVLTSGIPDDAYKTITGDDKEAAKLYRHRNKQECTGQRSMVLEAPQAISVELGADFAAFGALDERSPTDVQAKEDLYQQMRGSGTRWWDVKTACDLWTYAFIAPLRTAGPDGLDHVPTTDNVRNALQGRNIRPQLNGEANAASQVHPFFHWPLEFPDVFEHGGFDVVLGNPPWERIKLQEKEFFDTRDRDIAAAPNKAARERLIRALPQHNPALAEEWRQAVHGSESTSRFVRGSEQFPLTGRGDVNTYSIFAETARSICGPAGKVGIIVPSGIATDDTTKVFFADLVDRRSLVSLYDFENREKVFPGIDSRIKFCLLTLSGADRPSPQAEFAFFLYRAEQLQDADRRFVLAPEDFALFNPNTRTCPVFRTRRDADIAGKMYRRAGVFWKEARGGEPEENPWGVKFSAMFHMSNDSGLFRTRQQLDQAGWRLEGNIFVREDERYLPLYEAKLFHQYDHRFAIFEGVDEESLRGGNARDMTPAEKADPSSVVIPRYWVPEEEVEIRLDKREETSDTILDRQTIASRFGSSPERPTFVQHSAQSYRPTVWDTKRQSYCSGMRVGVEADRERDQPEDSDSGLDSTSRPGPQRSGYQTKPWLIPLRKTARATDERTCIASFVPRSGMSDRAPMLHLNEAEAASLVVAGLNSIVLDFAARTAVGGTDLSYFIIKQLPILPPEAFLEESRVGLTWGELVVPRVLELTYTAGELEPFARDLGYDGPPFLWDESRRHHIKCELDAIFAHMYQLDRSDLEWILDAPAPSSSFPGLKRSEMQEFGEYRTQRYVLQAYDQLARGELPNLDGNSR